VGGFLVALAVTGCSPAVAPASLTIDEMHTMTDSIADEVEEATEVFCDPAGDAGVANCYVGLNTDDEAAARSVLCDQVLPVTAEHTSGKVGLYAFNAADDQVILVATDC
jgi:hypothetical protein